MITAVNQATLPGRPSGDGTLYHRVLVLSAQHCADAFQGEPHADVEVLRGTRRHVARVGLQTFGVGIDEGLEDIVAVELPDTPCQPLVAFAQESPNLILFLLGEAQPEPFVLHPLAPDFVELGAVPCARCLGTVETVALRALEIEAGVQQGQGKPDPLGDPLTVETEDLEGDVEPTLRQVVVQTLDSVFEAIDIPAQKERSVGVQRFEVLLEDPFGKPVVQGHFTVMKVLQRLVDDHRGPLLAGCRHQTRNRDILRFGANQPRRQCQQEGNQQRNQALSHKSLFTIFGVTRPEKPT